MGAGVAFLDSVDTNLKCRGPDTAVLDQADGLRSVCVACGLGLEDRNDPSLFSLEFLKETALLPR